MMKTAVITGATSGIGEATAHGLSRQGYRTVILGRSQSRGRHVVKSINDSGGHASFTSLDLASLEDVERTAGNLVAQNLEIDVLVNNAGIGIGRGMTEDGFEIHFGVNHLGHFLLTRLLEPAMTNRPRVVQVSSEVHQRAKDFDFEHFTRRGRIPFGIDNYARSKVANILFVNELSRLRPTWNTYAVHPGLATTRIIPRFLHPFIRGRLLNPDQAADTVIWAAVSEELSNESGLYYARRAHATPSHLASDLDLASELWRRSEIWSGAWSRQAS